MDLTTARDKVLAFSRRYWPAILAVSSVAAVGLYLHSWLDVRSTVSNRKTSSGTVKRLNRQLREIKQSLNELADYNQPLDTRKPSALGPVKPASGTVKYTVADTDRLSSIARSPSEVIDLQKRGDRDYQVFQLPRSNRFRTVGPVRVSLRKIDAVHQRYDLEVKTHKVKIVKSGVRKLERINVPLDSRQNVEFVVNQISEDEVVGYVGIPKSSDSHASLY